MTIFGSRPLDAYETISARGLRPLFPARSSDITTRAHAPSFTPGALPAVTVPPSLKAGFRRARVSIEVSRRGPSSVSNDSGGPFFWDIGTATISALNLPASIAAIALRWLPRAYSSWTFREIPYFSATALPHNPLL